MSIPESSNVQHTEIICFVIEIFCFSMLSWGRDTSECDEGYMSVCDFVRVKQ